MIDYSHAERRVLDGDVDFTMMYAAHDAFARHLNRVITAVDADGAASAVARWTLFATQLHIHHTAEDKSLWPKLLEAVELDEERAILDAMEREHAIIDPLLQRIEAAFESSAREELSAALYELRDGLTAHMRHEENEALPLIQKYLGRTGWAKFGEDIRKTQGTSGGAVYCPWLLDGASDQAATKALAILPAPVRLLYRTVWVPKYQRSLR